MLVAPVLGKQVGKVSFMAGEAGKDIFQPGPGLDICRLAAAEQRVDDGGADGCVVVAGEEIVLAAKGQRPDGVLDAVVVDVVPPVENIAAQARKQRVRVDQGLAHPGLRLELVRDGIHPLLELLDDGIGLSLTKFFHFFSTQAGLAHLLLDLVQLADIHDGLARVLPVLVQGFHELAADVGPAADYPLAGSVLEGLIDLVTVGLHSAAVAADEFAGGVAAPGAHVVVEVYAPGERVAYGPHITLDGTVLLVVYYRQRALIHLYILTGHDLFSEFVV